MNRYPPHGILNAMSREKTIFILIIVSLLFLGTSIVGGLAAWLEYKKRQAREHVAVVERQIALYQKKLEELYRITEEEKKKRREETEVLVAQEITDDVKVEGVEVVSQGERKTLRNLTEGYEIQLPLNLVIARSVSSDTLEIHDKELFCKEDPECDPVMRISVRDANPKELPLNIWMDTEEKRVGEKIYSPRERLILSNQVVYRVREIIPRRFDGYYYYWGKGRKVYSLRISSFDEPTYGKFIETFSLR